MTTPTQIFFTYEIKDTQGTVLESVQQPVLVRLGTGQVSPFLEEHLKKQKPGEKSTVNLKAAEAFGEYNEALIFKVPIEKIPSPGNLGDVLTSKNQQGEDLHLRIIDKDEQVCTLDGNHPFAGQDLVFDITVVDPKVTAKGLDSGEPSEGFEV
ncbi:MAG: FKBP-type peptidyl-prolyl cis-trans isomerase [Deltaproteobacteria bacterium]|nr:FKBP-type peptidyl-prolyl cis-trans isomerase [Deltaproteobacteria bacterium]